MNLLEINPAGNMKAQRDIEVGGQIKASRLQGNGDGTLTISGNVDFVGTVQMFAGPQLVEDWTPSAGSPFRDSVATQDGFLSVIVTLTNRDNTDCYVEGFVNDLLMGAASVNGVANEDWPIWTNSFMMPVSKGATWKVKCKQDTAGVREYPVVQMRWTPLGR